MYVVCIHVRVHPENRQDFIDASLENARETIQEPGNLRFDVNQQLDDPDRFVLYEVYRDESGMEAHKETAHYAKWRDIAEPMLVKPRSRTKYRNLAPADPGWETPGA